MFVVNLAIAGGLQFDQPVTGPIAERSGDARRRIAMAKYRIFALEPPRQARFLLAHDVGDQGIALHIIARGAVADEFDMIDQARRDTLADGFERFLLSRGTRAVDHNISNRKDVSLGK